MLFQVNLMANAQFLSWFVFKESFSWIHQIECVGFNVTLWVSLIYFDLYTRIEFKNSFFLPDYQWRCNSMLKSATSFYWQKNLQTYRGFYMFETLQKITKNLGKRNCFTNVSILLWFSKINPLRFGFSFQWKILQSKMNLLHVGI